MIKRRGLISSRFAAGSLVGVVALSLLVECGGSSSDQFTTPGDTAGSGGTAGSLEEAGTANGGKPSAGSSSGGAAGMGEAGADTAAGAAGAAGEAPIPPPNNHSALSFVAAGSISISKHFKLISNLGESLGGTTNSKRAKSQKYVYVPGVVAAASP